MANVHHLDPERAPRPPSNLDAELALLGCILFDNGAFERVGDNLAPENFYEPFHQRLYGAMVERIRKGQLADPVTVMDRFRRDPGFEELGGLQYLADLVERAPPAANAPDYARTIRDAAVRRALIDLGGRLSRDAADEQFTGTDIVEAAEGELYGLVERGPRSGGSKTFAEVLTGAVEAAARAFDRDGGLSGLSTGLIDLDKILGGLSPSDLLILAARPSMGKSGLAMNIGYHLASRYAYEQLPDGSRRTTAGAIVQFFSLEMSGEQLAMRVLAEVSGVSSDRIRKGEIEAHEFGLVRDAALEIQSAPLFVDDTGGLSLAQLCARARRQKRTVGLDLVIVDYLQLVTTPGMWGDNRVQQVSEITQGLKALAKELNVPVLALSQLSRKVEDREDKKPQLADLRESGSIEQDADVVMFIYREAYYHARTEPRPGTPEHIAWQDHLAEIAHLADVIVAKQRHGPVGTVHLHYNDGLTKFTNLAREGRYRDAEGRVKVAKPEPPGQREIIYSGQEGP